MDIYRIVEKKLEGKSREKCVIEALKWCDAFDVVGIYEKDYPNDNRVRVCIDTIRKWLKNPNAENLERVKKAADAAYAAAYAAYAVYAADAAANAADAAYAAYVAAHVAADATYAVVKKGIEAKAKKLIEED